MPKKNDLKEKMKGGLSQLIQPTTPGHTPLYDNETPAPEPEKRVHANFVMKGDIHKRMKAVAARKGITLISALEAACEKYLEENEG